MMNRTTGPGPSLNQKPDEVLDIGKERELRALRTKVAELEQRLAVRAGRPIPATVPRATSDEKHGYKCGFHPQVDVSMEVEEINCAVCDEELNPYEVLRDFVNRERNFVFGLERMIQEEKSLTAQVAALKKEKANLSAQVRRKGGKPADICTKADWQSRFGK